VRQDEYVVVVPDGHPLAGRPRVGLRELNGQRMLLSGGGCETLIEELLAAAGSNPEIVCVVRDNATLASMVAGGLGLTVMPELALPASRMGLKLLRLRPTLRRTLHLLTRPPDARGPMVLALIDAAEASVPANP
jgi:DNA-binding transcriptional LysR family regulator